MSCGTKISTTFSFQRHDLVDALEREGEYSIARRVMHDDCLDSHDLRRAESALDRQGKSKYFDYREENCRCETEEF